MKSAALLFVLIFTFALVAPTVASFCDDEIAVLFTTDEENNNSQKSNIENEKKESVKLFFLFTYDKEMITGKTEIKSVDIFTLHSPFLGIVTPPPDNC